MTREEWLALKPGTIIKRIYDDQLEAYGHWQIESLDRTIWYSIPVNKIAIDSGWRRLSDYPYYTIVEEPISKFNRLLYL